MNNTFSITRFGWLFKKTFSERPVQLLGFMGIAMALSLAVYVFFKFADSYELAQNASFVIGLVGCGCFMAAMVFNYFSTNASGASFLTLPASQLEKWFCGVLIAGVLYTVVFLLLFRVMDTGFVALYHKGLDRQSPFYQQQYDAVQVFSFTGFVASRVMMMYYNFAGAILLGAFYFNRASFIKTAMVLCVVCFGGILLNLLIANLFFNNVNSAFPYFFVWITAGKATGRQEISGPLHRGIMIIFQYIIPLILWGLAYLRLREKEF